MTYLLLVVLFAGAAAVVLAWAVRRASARPGDPGPSGRAIGLSLAVLVVTTLVFDNLMIAAGLFEFADEHLVGLFVGRAPLEDLGYPLAGVLLLPALWHLLGAGRRTGRDVRRRAGGDA